MASRLAGSPRPTYRSSTYTLPVKSIALLLHSIRQDQSPETQRRWSFDAWNGYYSVSLHEDDQNLTTFITLRGRYHYRITLKAYTTSGDGYTRRYDEIVPPSKDQMCG